MSATAQGAVAATVARALAQVDPADLAFARTHARNAVFEASVRIELAQLCESRAVAMRLADHFFAAMRSPPSSPSRGT